jgi:acyl carrier protein
MATTNRRFTYSRVGRGVVKVLTEALGLEEDEITPGSKIKEDLGAESIDFLDIKFRIEREFGVVVKTDEVAKATAMGLVELIYRLTAD